MSTPTFDVAVIGGGLAGCSSTIQLAHQGHRVTLFELQRYPHHKVCGEFLSPECSEMLADLGLSAALQAVKPASIKTVKIIAPDGSAWTSALPGVGMGISRYALDHLMAEQARKLGVVLRTGATVTDVQGNLDAGFTLTMRDAVGQQTVQARAVIGAYGKRGNLDRKLQRDFFSQPQPFIGLKAHFRGQAPSEAIHLHSFPGGYCGLSEIENGLVNVCLLVRQDVFQATCQPSVEHFVNWMMGQNPTLGKWLSGAERVSEEWLSISQVPFARKQVIVDDVLMAGDAAGLIAPVAGDGMGMALQTGKMASEVLGAYLNGQISASEVRQRYPRLWWRTFGVRLRLSRTLQAFMLRPNWLTPGLKIMNSVPAVGRLLMTYTRDRQLVHS